MTSHVVTLESMKPADMPATMSQLIQFRQQLYDNLEPRPDAIVSLLDALADRGYVYAPNTIASNKPVTIGHQYSALVLQPQKRQPFSPPWVVPLSMRRVTSDETKQVVGAKQVQALLSDDTLPFGQKLCVPVTDSHYSCVTYLGMMTPYENLVTVARARSNHTFYRQPPAGFRPPKRGHPTWYGERFDLKAPETWGTPDELLETTFTNRRGKTYTVVIKAWYDMLRRGTREYPMSCALCSAIRS